MAEWICEPLTIEDQVIQTSLECSPTKWQLGHTSWFFETFVLKNFAKDYKEFNPKYNYLFNSYYNTIGERTARDIRGLLSRPTVSEVLAYRAYIEEALLAFAEYASDTLWEQAAPAILLGMHHEEQHLELILTDVKTVLALNPLNPIYRNREISSVPHSELRWIAVEAGLIQIGANSNGFSFDNEGPRHQVFLQPFYLANRLITNREYLDFMLDGGYENPVLWLSDGWAFAQSQQWTAPKYWAEQEGTWWNMTLQGMRPVEMSEPVTHVSHYEADAFATWRAARLPTEFEWEHAASQSSPEGNSLNNGNFHPIASTPQSEGLSQMFGDCWEWTRSAYLPYPGYRPAPGAIGEYNGKFMSNQMVLKGGSCATPKDHARGSYRNFFPPDARWQFTGIRLAKDAG